MQARRTNVDRTAETRGLLLAAARSLFARNGYADTGTPQIAAEANVTRGALYHHFEDKADLLRALVAAESEAVLAAINDATSGIADPQKALDAGANAYLDAMGADGRTRLLLVDAPVVLGHQTSDAIDATSIRATLSSGLAAAMGTAPSPELVDLVSAAFDRAALRCAEGGDRAALVSALTRLVDAVAGADPTCPSA